MKKFLLLFLPLACIIVAHSQNFNWKGIISSSGSGGIVDSEMDQYGNTYIMGWNSSGGTISLPHDSSALNASATYILKINPMGDTIWISYLGNAQGNFMSLDNNNNIYIAGGYNGLVDFDPGPGFAMHNSWGLFAGFILKTDSNGHFLDVYTFDGGTGTLYMGNFDISASNEIYLSGQFQYTIDFDPGVDTAYLSTGSTYSSFILKMGLNGNLIWVKKLGVFSPSKIIASDPNNIFIAGSYGGIFDANPDSLIDDNLTAVGSTDVVVLKLDTNGTLLWKRSIGGVGDDAAVDMLIDGNSNLFLTGTYMDNPDFDPGPGTCLQPSLGLSDVFLLKLTNGGNLVWCDQVGSSNWEYVNSCIIDSANNFYIPIRSSGMVDHNPDPYICDYPPHYNSGGFIAKYNQNGNFIWAKDVYSNSPTYIGVSKVLSVDNNNNVLVAGYFETPMYLDSGLTNIQLYPPNLYSHFLISFGQDGCSNLALAVDTLINSTCSLSGSISVKAEGGVAPYTYSWNSSPIVNDSILYPTHSGVYMVTVSDAVNCQRSGSIVYTAPTSTDSFDLNVNLITTQFRPGFNSDIWLDVLNEGCIGTNGQLILAMDPLISLVNATPTPDVVIGDTLKWNFSTLTYDSVHFIPHILINTNTSAVIGDSIHLVTTVKPFLGDADLANNTKVYIFPVVNAFDPNDKKVYPVGICDEGYIETNDELTYTVRFQNTGNSSAFTIHVIDTFDLDLDLTTLRVVGASHSYAIDALAPRILRFRFDNILLPDSGSNEPLSHGYIVFSIKAKPSTPNLSHITNTANIYFDYNLPVITNTVSNITVNALSDCSSIGISENQTALDIILYPNPTCNFLYLASNEIIEDANILIYNISGQVQILKRSYINDKIQKLDLSDLCPGMYFIHIYSEGKKGIFKVVKN